MPSGHRVRLHNFYYKGGVPRIKFLGLTFTNTPTHEQDLLHFFGNFHFITQAPFHYSSLIKWSKSCSPTFSIALFLNTTKNRLSVDCLVILMLQQRGLFWFYELGLSIWFLINISHNYWITLYVQQVMLEYSLIKSLWFSYYRRKWHWLQFSFPIIAKWASCPLA